MIGPNAKQVLPQENSIEISVEPPLKFVLSQIYTCIENTLLICPVTTINAIGDPTTKIHQVMYVFNKKIQPCHRLGLIYKAILNKQKVKNLNT